MSKTDPYFQFPVSMLRNSCNTQNLVQDIVARTMLKVGNSIYLESPDAVEAIVDQHLAVEEPPSGFVHENLNHHILFAGAKRLNVSIGNVPTALKRATLLLDKFPDAGTQCRIRADIAWSAHNSGWPINKLKVLCGVIGAIGDKDCATFNYRMIRAIGAGHNSPKGVHDSDLLTVKTVRLWTEELWLKNLFQSCKDGTKTWYSIRHENDRDLAASVKKMTRPTAKKRISVNDV